MAELFVDTDFVFIDFVEGDDRSAEGVLEAWFGASGSVGDPERQAVIALEVTITKVSDGVKSTLYFADTRYRTAPDHTPPNQNFLARLESSDTSISLASSDSLARRGARSASVVRLLNNDGRLDQWLDGSYEWEGGAIAQLVGGDTWDYSTFKPIIPAGIINTKNRTEKWVELNIGLALADFEEPLQSDLYVLSEGSIQDSDDAYILDSDDEPIDTTDIQATLIDSLVGSPKPLVWGWVRNMAPRLIATNYGANGYSVYQINNGAIEELVTVYEGGLPMEEGTDYIVNTEAGTFELISRPVATITCEVKGSIYVNNPGGHSIYHEDAASIAKQILIQQVGLVDMSEVDTDAFTAYSAKFSQVAGYAATEEITRGEALDFLFGPVGWWATTFPGDKITCGWLRDTAEWSPTTTLNSDSHIASMSNPRSEAPAWRTRLAYGRNYARVSDLLGAADEEVRDWIQRDWSVSIGAEVPEANRVPQSRDLPPFETPFLEEPSVALEAFVLAIFDTRREVYEIRLARVPQLLWLGDIPNVVYPRWGFDSGQKLYVIGSRVNPAARDFRLTAWG